MILNGKLYGTPVAGTNLVRHGDAPRRCAADRNRQGWFECTMCGEFKTIRVQDVKPGTTVSCGCVGRKQFITHYEQRAANLPTHTQEKIFSLAHHPSSKKRVTAFELAKRFKLAKYVIDFIIAARCRVLKSMALAGHAVVNVLSRIEARWMKWTSIWQSNRMDRDNRRQFLDGLNWRNRGAYLEAERAENAANRAACAGISEDTVRALICDPASEVEFVRWAPLSGWMTAAA